MSDVSQPQVTNLKITFPSNTSTLCLNQHLEQEIHSHTSVHIDQTGSSGQSMPNNKATQCTCTTIGEEHRTHRKSKVIDVHSIHSKYVYHVVFIPLFDLMVQNSVSGKGSEHFYPLLTLFSFLSTKYVICTNDKVLFAESGCRFRFSLSMPFSHITSQTQKELHTSTQI